MKQTIVILTVIMVLLLGVSGVIVAGSLQQSDMLVARVNQVNELNTRLKQQNKERQEAEARAEEAETALMTAKAGRDEALLQLEDALNTLEAVNEELTRRDGEHEQAQTAQASEMSALSARILAAEKENEQLMGKLNGLTAQHETLEKEKQTIQQERDGLIKARDEAEQRVETLRLELKAVKDAALEQDAAYRLLQQEVQAFGTVVQAWQTARQDGGDLSVSAYAEASAAFAQAYPESSLSLPELPAPTAAPEPTATAQPMAQPQANAGESAEASAENAATAETRIKETPAAAPKATPTPTPRPTFKPIVTTTREPR